MKKLTLIVLTIFSISSSYGQINMSASGNVLFGAGSPNPSYKVYVNGESFFTCNTSPANGFSFVGYNVGVVVPMIRPYSNNSMWLGSSSMMLNRIYTYNLNVNGVWITSDSKLKENIRPLVGSLNNISMLKPVKFDYKAELYNDSLCFDREKLIADGKGVSGFIANELQEVLPKLVEYNKEADRLEINYVGLIPEKDMGILQ